MKKESLYKFVDSKNRILELYDRKLDELAIQYESIYIDTAFGKTHVLKTGSPTLPPLILVHGANGCAPIALDCYPNLSTKYQVFAIDVMAQPNRSSETRLSMKDTSYGQWLNEVIRSLKLENVVLAGFSFGGLIILKTLEDSQENIKEVFIASPAYVVNGNPLKALMKLFIPLKLYIKKQKLKHLKSITAELFTNVDPFALDFLSVVFPQFDQDFTPVPVISSGAAQSISTPITVLGAGKDLIFPGKRMKKRATKIFPSLKQFVLLDNSKHVQDEKGNTLFENLIVESTMVQ